MEKSHGGNNSARMRHRFLVVDWYCSSVDPDENPEVAKSCHNSAFERFYSFLMMINSGMNGTGDHRITAKGEIKVPDLERYLWASLQCLQTAEWKDFNIQIPCENYQTVSQGISTVHFFL